MRVLRILLQGGHSEERQAVTTMYIGQGLPDAGRPRPGDNLPLDRGGTGNEHLNFDAAMKLRASLSSSMPRGTGNLYGSKVE
jgi:hypothetical protein